MSVWREVQERLALRWTEEWGQTAPFAFGNESLDTPDSQWCQVLFQSRPGGPATLGKPGNRKMDRRGVVFILLREPPLNGTGNLSDLAERAKDVFEGCAFAPHGIHFGVGDIGDEGMVDKDRWWGVTVEVPFWYEQIK